MKRPYDVIVIGAGIIGLAHAWRAAVRGLRVLVLERSPRAEGASVRNFGMIWPIGQPLGGLYATAMRSRRLWLELAEQAGIWLEECGSLHLAHAADEWAVLEEFCELANGGDVPVELLNATETFDKSPATNRHGLRGSLWSPLEMCVHPHDVIRSLPNWLHEAHSVDFQFATTALAIDAGEVVTSCGKSIPAPHILVCGGDEMRSLYPHELAAAGVRRCKLQMMRTVRQPDGWRMGPHLASGLTLRHYPSFQSCPSLSALRERIAIDTPELDHFGIHVMAAQNDAGQVVLGDSHEYDDAISPLDRVEIDELILRELRRQIDLPDWTIERRWHGCYAKPTSESLLRLQPAAGVTICVSPGGAGMTMSMGWAEEFWQQELAMT